MEKGRHFGIGCKCKRPQFTIRTPVTLRRMPDLAEKALDAATRRGVSYADVRVEHTRHRQISTRNGRPGQIASHESLGVGIRVIADGCWGFASTDDLSSRGLDHAVALAVEIARSGVLAKKSDVQLAPEDAFRAEWTSECAIDPFATAVEDNLALLMSVDAELRRTEGITLAETSLVFARSSQVFASSIGSRISQTRTTCGAGYTALAFKDGELQKRSYPNSFGGQYQLKGY